jgi:hypothetical protein
MTWKLEAAPILINLFLFLAYLWKWDEPGKVIYWLGATVLSVGLYIMKG